VVNQPNDSCLEPLHLDKLGPSNQSLQSQQFGQPQEVFIEPQQVFSQPQQQFGQPQQQFGQPQQQFVQPQQQFGQPQQQFNPTPASGGQFSPVNLLPEIPQQTGHPLGDAINATRQYPGAQTSFSEGQPSPPQQPAVPYQKSFFDDEKTSGDQERFSTNVWESQLDPRTRR